MFYDDKVIEGNIYQVLCDMKCCFKFEDSLIIYYLGYGYYDDEIDEGFWIFVDVCKNDESSYISNVNIVKCINLLKMQYILLIVDSCFFGLLVVCKCNVVFDECFKFCCILVFG